MQLVKVVLVTVSGNDIGFTVEVSEAHRLERDLTQTVKRATMVHDVDGSSVVINLNHVVYMTVEPVEHTEDAWDD